MMKKILALLLALCLMFSLAACGGEEIEAEENHGITGIWEYEDLDYYLIFDEDGAYAMVSKIAPEIADEGVYTIEGANVMMSSNDGYAEILLMGDEYMYDSVNNSIRFVAALDSDLYYSILASLEEEQPYFEQRGFEINYEFDEGGADMTNGAYAFLGDGEYYCTLPTTVWIELDSYNDTRDGYAEIEFTKTVYLDSTYFPEFVLDGSFDTMGITTRLYDYYTGYWLSDGGGVTGDSDRGDNSYYYEYESQGQTICVDFNFSTEWTKEADGSYILEMHCFVRMPADYDGIIYGSLEACPDYDSYLLGQMADDKLHIMDDTDTVNALLCRVNTIY